jgi:Na+/alanine symporter
VICTLTALTILVSGVPISYGTDGGGTLTSKAFSCVYGSYASLWLAAVMTLLAVATVLLGAYVGLSRLNPEIFDSILYSAEELEILNYRK